MNYMLNNSTVHNHIKFTNVAGDKMNDKYHTRYSNQVNTE